MALLALPDRRPVLKRRTVDNIIAALIGGIILLAAIVLFVARIPAEEIKTVSSDPEPYFIVKESAKTGDGSFLIIQPLSPVQFIAHIEKQERMPLKGESMKCKVDRVTSGKDAEGSEYSKVALACSHGLELVINTLVFPPN